MRPSIVSGAVEYSGGLLTTFLLAFIFFLTCVRPAVGTAFPDSTLFLLATSSAHTAMAGIGFGTASSLGSSGNSDRPSLNWMAVRRLARLATQRA